MPDTGAPWNIPYVTSADLVSDWPADSLSLANAVASGLTAASGLVEVKSALKTNTFSASIAVDTSTAITDLSITHALSDASNSLLISVYIGGAAVSTTTTGRYGIAVYDGTTMLAVGDAGGAVQQRTTAGGERTSSGSTSVSNPVSFMFEHAPGDTTSRTYDVHIFNADIGTRTFYVNRNVRDANDRVDQRNSSSLVIMEVSV